MTDSRNKNKKPKRKDRIEDEPGAEERFKQLVKRALNTPPQHRTGEDKRKRKSQRGR